ncbi:MAG: aminoglycoside phosphotransferase family protein [Vampirovibrio sp.]|nr:aminoglycoside phosphotransferase family protein [Vampirovibrio sp.]
MDSELKHLLLEQVFPIGTSFSFHPAESNKKGQKFWVVPGSQGLPRWIIPQDAELGFSVLKHWLPFDPVSKMKWQCMITGYRLGLLPFFAKMPGVKLESFWVSMPENTRWDHLGWQQCEKSLPVPVIYVGTPSTYTKLVVMLIDSDSKKPQMTIKVPWGKHAASRILYEATILKKLGQETPGIAPKFLWQDDARSVSSQEYLAGYPTQPDLTENHVQWLIRLLQESRTASVSEKGILLKKKLDGLAEKMSSALVQTLQETLQRLQDKTPLPLVWRHGDYTAWNIFRSSGGQFVVIDWENAEPDALPLYDIFHFKFAQDRVFQPNLQNRGKACLDWVKTNPEVRSYLIALNMIKPCEEGESLINELFLYYLIDYLLLSVEDEIDDLVESCYQAILEVRDDCYEDSDIRICV